jgi:hypothetical protein
MANIKPAPASQSQPVAKTGSKEDTKAHDDLSLFYSEIGQLSGEKSSPKTTTATPKTTGQSPH